ncbi:formate dehydrogenase subunit delta [Aureimonas endophytica]|uniref:Formate dehydrogenase subunit delta n=1 Tax=Aureimonas endophytica TaxID=2027858 RepID=A0A917E7X2_9HYPH|nr:formate dehydrogenase subunit delta [Aureimonas endophytica]GGE13736.1 formate dehydrogenase subunit delta [Aureimonas endophytica]
MQADDKLLRMANQIAIFCASNPRAEARAPALAEHINKFWDPRMRVALLALVEGGRATGLHPLVVEAAPAIRPPC